MADAPIERSVEVEASPDDVWELLVDDDDRAEWFGGPTELRPEPGTPATFTDPDGTRREATVGDVEPGTRIDWVWWPAERRGDDDGASHVSVTLEPTTIGTRVTVTEVPLVPMARASMSATTRSAMSMSAAFPLLDLEYALLCRSLLAVA